MKDKAAGKAIMAIGGILAANQDRHSEKSALKLMDHLAAASSSLLQSNSSLILVGAGGVNQEEEPSSMIEVEPDSDLAY